VRKIGTQAHKNLLDEVGQGKSGGNDARSASMVKKGFGTKVKRRRGESE